MKTVAQLLKTKAPGVISIKPDASVIDAVRLLAEKSIGAILVLENERLVGIVSERDLARKVALVGKSADEMRVSDIMTRQVLFVTPTHTNEECMALMTDKRVRHLPVIDNGRVVGVLSIGDLVKDTICEQQFIIEQLVNYIHR
ncbi:MAG: CBS domain-containing protein [Betaproteobacteria bacterium]|nr:CBS domain-containing protein [Betaproteobacteria bacterium]